MATWQGLTFGGWAPAETQGESAMSFAWNGKDLRRNIRYQKRMIRFQNEQSKGLSLWSAQNMPKATMEGLKSAGLNPLLAAGGSTNVAPMVASSAASVPSNQSFVEGGSVNGGGDINALSDLFSGTSKLERRARKTTAEATVAEQEARREFFQSPEGRRAVRDRLRMDYGPQSTMQAAVLGAHTAKDGISTAGKAVGDNPQWFNWLTDGSGKTRSPSTGNTTHTDDNGRVVVSRRRTYSPRDNRRDNRRYSINFNFGSSARRTYDSGAHTNRPVWYNPDVHGR